MIAKSIINKKMKNDFTLNIPNPCGQKWQEMLPTQQGKICSNCATEVIDFTKLSNDELRVWFSKSNGERVCGNFHQFQLEAFNKGIISKNFWQNISAKILLASCFTFMVTSKGIAKPQMEQSVYKAVQGLSRNNHKGQSIVVGDSLILVKGTVRSSDDKLPIQAVYVTTKDRKINTLTDKNGNFSILVPKTKTVILVFRWLGYDGLTKEVSLKEQAQIEIFMKPSKSIMGEVVIQKPSSFKRFWNILKSPFIKKS